MRGVQSSGPRQAASEVLDVMLGTGGRSAGTYEAALARAKGNIKNCDDAALMASFLAGDGQLLIGAVSPKLVWQGAQAKGLSTQQLLRMIHDDAEHGTFETAELMWVTS